MSTKVFIIIMYNVCPSGECYARLNDESFSEAAVLSSLRFFLSYNVLTTMVQEDVDVFSCKVLDCRFESDWRLVGALGKESLELI